MTGAGANRRLLHEKLRASSFHYSFRSVNPGGPAAETFPRFFGRAKPPPPKVYAQGWLRFLARKAPPPFGSCRRAVATSPTLRRNNSNEDDFSISEGTSAEDTV